VILSANLIFDSSSPCCTKYIISQLPFQFYLSFLLDGAAVFRRLGCVLAAQVGLDEGGEDDADHERGARENVGRRVAPLAKQPAVDQGEYHAENLRARVQNAGRGAFRLRISQLGAEFKAHRQVASHEESAGQNHTHVKM